MAKYIDYEFTPAIYHELRDSDGKDKSRREPATLVFISDTGERRHVIPGGPEAEILFAEVRKNNPAAHGVTEEEKTPEKQEEKVEEKAEEAKLGAVQEG